MWFNEAGEVVEMFKNSFPLSFLVFVPLLILISPVSPVGGAHDFPVYRMQQFDLAGTPYGCRNALVNVEARSVDSNMFTRRCMVARFQEVTMEKVREMLGQNAAGLLVLLPQNLSSLSPEHRQLLMTLEHDFLQEEVQMPVYFARETPELLDIYHSIKGSISGDQAGSAAEALLSTASANGFQLLVNGAQSKALNDYQITNIQGKLTGYGVEEQLPTVVMVAHYDSYGLAPSLSFGTDSNASGVVALLELARLFAKLYTNSRTHAKYNMLFLLSGAGKFNYHGTKRWIEDNLDSADTSLLVDASYVLCLDTLAQDNTLNLHVSKPPREGLPGHTFLQNLKDVVAQFFPEVAFNMQHKKINLADDLLAWEHERFSIRKLPAFTLSRLSSHRDLHKNSILDVRDQVDTKVLSRNIKIVAEALARHVFNLSSQGSFEVFDEPLEVEEGLVSAWLDFLASRSRAAQVLYKDHPVITTLEQGMARYLKDVRRSTVRADKREPEFLFYSGHEYTMSAYNVKPAVFDLFLGLVIAAYLGVIYLAIQNFHLVFRAMRLVASPVKTKVQ